MKWLSMTRRRGFAKDFAKDFAKGYGGKRRRTKTQLEKNLVDAKQIVNEINRQLKHNDIDQVKVRNMVNEFQDRMNAQAKADESKSRRSTGKKNLN